MFVVERSGVRRVRFDERDHRNEGSIAIMFQKFAGLGLDKFRFRKFEGHVARKSAAEEFPAIRLVPFIDEELRIIGDAFDFVPAWTLKRFLDRDPVLETALR